VRTPHLMQPRILTNSMTGRTFGRRTTLTAPVLYAHYLKKSPQPRIGGWDKWRTHIRCFQCEFGYHCVLELDVKCPYVGGGVTASRARRLSNLPNAYGRLEKPRDILASQFAFGNQQQAVADAGTGEDSLLPMQLTLQLPTRSEQAKYQHCQPYSTNVASCYSAEAARQWATLAYKWYGIELGSDSEQSRAALAIMRAPESHSAWGTRPTESVGGTAGLS
jgi:hypothetical protein